MSHMAKGKEDFVAVRLTDDLKRRLEAISERTGIEKSVLVRSAVKALVEEAEKQGGHLTLPLALEIKAVSRKAATAPARRKATA